MAVSLIFKKQELMEAENDYSRLKVAPKQRIIIDQLADLLSKYTGMSKLPMKGFLWKAMKTWQQEYGQRCDTVLSLPFLERLEKVKQMLAILESQYLQRVLRHPNDHEKLSKAIQAAFDYYKEIGKDL